MAIPDGRSVRARFDNLALWLAEETRGGEHLRLRFGVLRWLGLNLLLAVVTASLAYLVVGALGAAGLRTAGTGPLELGDYVVALLLSAWIMWPAYMGALALVSRHRRHQFRRWAVGLSLLLGAVPPGIIFVTLPEIQAAILFYLLYGVTVRPLPATTGPPPDAPGEPAPGGALRSPGHARRRRRDGGGREPPTPG